MSKNWTDLELQQLKKYCSNKFIEDLEKILSNKTKSQIQNLKSQIICEGDSSLHLVVKEYLQLNYAQNDEISNHKSQITNIRHLHFTFKQCRFVKFGK